MPARGSNEFMPSMTTIALQDSLEHPDNHLEFEVPSSAKSPDYKPISPSRHKKGRFSIDLSLELERQLEAMESLPSTPSRNAHNNTRSTSSVHSNEIPLDPHVLANIVTGLRQSLTDMTKEREDLMNLLSSATEKEAELNDALQLMTDKATTMEEELSEAKKKIQDDEEAINMLRSKVEESRRGLMRLQSENRRQSVQSLDLSRAGIPLFSSGPSSSKRASFTPLTGAHNNISTSPNAHTLSFPDSNAPSSRRISGMFSRTQPELDPHTLELESLRKELNSLKESLEDTRSELSEAIEAKEASETCVKALREFIAENNIGPNNDSASVNLPPFPSSTTGNEVDAKKPPAGGWGFNKLWKMDTAQKLSNHTPAASLASPITPASNLPDTSTTPEPLSRKFTGFFTRAGSISSIPSTPALQPNVPSMSQRDSTCSSSDASSLAEPASPILHASINVVVRDGSDMSSMGSSPPTGMKQPEIVPPQSIAMTGQ